MTTATHTWQDLFVQQRHALLGMMAPKNANLMSLADDETSLHGGAGEAARLSQRPAKGPAIPVQSVVLTPDDESQTSEEYRAKLRGLREAYPEAEISGFGPLHCALSERFEVLDRGTLMLGHAGLGFQPNVEDLAQLASLAGTPYSAVLLYSPEVTPQALSDAASQLANLPAPVSLVPLPSGAGDRIPLAGLTTAGSTDMMVISALRILLPRTVRVRASWAALGWKVAQVGLAYGADEIAGWSAAEALAYTGRVRSAARVERAELNEGIAEARLKDGGWYNQGEAR